MITEKSDFGITLDKLQAQGFFFLKERLCCKKERGKKEREQEYFQEIHKCLGKKLKHQRTGSMINYQKI